jgi:hypothetical protein
MDHPQARVLGSPAVEDAAAAVARGVIDRDDFQVTAWLARPAEH